MKVTSGSSGEAALAGEGKGRLRTCVCTYPTDHLKVGLARQDTQSHPGTPDAAQ